MGERKHRYIFLTTLLLFRLVHNEHFTHISMMMLYLPCNWLSSAWQLNQTSQDQACVHFTFLHAQAKHWAQGELGHCVSSQSLLNVLQQQDCQNEIFKILWYQCLSSCCSNKQFSTELLSITVGDALTPWVTHPSFPNIYIYIKVGISRSVSSGYING